MAKTVMTPIGVLNFPTFFEPKGNKQNPTQAPRFSGMLLFDDNDNGIGTSAYKELRLAVKEAIAEKFGEAKSNDAAFVKSLRLPFRPASDKDYAGFEDGEIFISAWKKGDEGAPGVLDLNGDKMLVPGDVFSGQLARFTVRPFAYDSNGNKGVGFYLEHVQIVKTDMPRLDGRQSADAAFAGAAADDDQLRQLGIAPGTGAGGSAKDDDDELPF